MRLCGDCANLLANSICGHYGKEPPKGFAERCRHFDEREQFTESETAGDCEQCGRFDRDHHGDWCLAAVDEKFIHYRKLPSNKPCPLT